MSDSDTEQSSVTAATADSFRDIEALRSDLAALRVSLPVIEGSGSTTTTVSVSMLRRLYDAALFALQSEPSQGDDDTEARP